MHEGRGRNGDDQLVEVIPFYAAILRLVEIHLLSTGLCFVSLPNGTAFAPDTLHRLEKIPEAAIATMTSLLRHHPQDYHSLFASNAMRSIWSAIDWTVPSHLVSPAFQNSMQRDWPIVRAHTS